MKKQKEQKLEFRTVHKYKNKTYRPEVLEDLKKDTYRVIHWVEDEDGVMHEAEFTPYHRMSKGDFQMYVDLGCPSGDERPWNYLRLRNAFKLTHK